MTGKVLTSIWTLTPIIPQLLLYDYLVATLTSCSDGLLVNWIMLGITRGIAIKDPIWSPQSALKNNYQVS